MRRVANSLAPHRFPARIPLERSRHARPSLDPRAARAAMGYFVPMRAFILDLIRHGQAAPGDASRDHTRALTPAGRAALERLGARLARDGSAPDRLLASPLERAQQSAEALREAFATPPAIETLDELAPDSTPIELLAALRRLGLDGGHVALVGHQPLLGQLALLLTSTEASFAPGSLVRIECRDAPAAGAGRILLIVHP
jgi:phosphohistidine phosphatase